MNEKEKRMEQIHRRIKDCENCDLSESRDNAVPGEGNLNARLFLIAQAPGKTEDKEGRMFIGPSGNVLNQLLEASSIHRNELYMTNLVKCMLPDHRKPKDEEIQACSRYLDEEIDIVHPKILVPLGWYSTRYLFQKYDLHIPTKTSDVFARLRWIKRDDVKIFPQSHPAALLYDNTLKDQIFHNYKKLRVISQQCKWYPYCPMKRYYEDGALDRTWIERYCKGDWESCVRYQMEAKGRVHPDWMLPNGSIDERLK